MRSCNGVRSGRLNGGGLYGNSAVCSKQVAPVVVAYPKRFTDQQSPEACAVNKDIAFNTRVVVQNQFA